MSNCRIGNPIFHPFGENSIFLSFVFVFLFLFFVLFFGENLSRTVKEPSQSTSVFLSFFLLKYLEELRPTCLHILPCNAAVSIVFMSTFICSSTSSFRGLFSHLVCAAAAPKFYESKTKFRFSCFDSRIVSSFSSLQI